MNVAPGHDGDQAPARSTGRTWAPWVVVTSAVLVVANFILCGLNFAERHYQQQRLSGTSDPTRIHDTLESIRHLGSFDLIVSTVFFVTGVIWARKRRPRERLKREGESAVQPALRQIVPIVYWAFLGMVAISIALSWHASSLSHVGMSINDVVTYRTDLAIGAAARTIMWACMIVLVVQATRIEARQAADDEVRLVPRI
jgi:hypothetical protein